MRRGGGGRARRVGSGWRRSRGRGPVRVCGPGGVSRRPELELVRGGGRRLRAQRLGGRYRRRREDPDRAVERHRVEAGAQPEPRGQQHPGRRGRNLRAQRLGGRRGWLRPDSDRGLEWHRVDAGAEPAPGGRRLALRGGRHVGPQRVGGRICRQSGRQLHQDPDRPLERHRVDAGAQPRNQRRAN